MNRLNIAPVKLKTYVGKVNNLLRPNRIVTTKDDDSILLVHG
jgi:hypothetical protein